MGTYSREYYEKNKDKIKEKSRLWKLENPDKNKKNRDAWELKNKEKRSQIMARYYQSHKELVYQRAREYCKSHPGWETQQKKLRRAILAGSKINDFTYEQWLEVLEEHNYTCFYCKKDHIKLTQDHVIPISKMGNHTKSNIVPACVSCNSIKHNKILEEVIGY